MKNRVEGTILLRIYAMLCVIACHTAFLAPSAGGVGNKIFFVMGGFLAFVSLVGFDGKKNVTIKNALNYYKKRVLRIIPCYWLILLGVWRLLPGIYSLRDFSSEKSLVLNMFFIKTFGHLWFMQQIMLMYILAPVILFISELFRKKICKNTIIISLLFLIAAAIEKRFFTADILRLSGEGSHQQFQIWMFLIGISAAYLCMELKRKNIFINKFQVADLYALLFFVLLTITVVPPFADCFKVISTFFGGEVVRAFMIAVYLVLYALNKNTINEKIFTRQPFIICSDITFPMYLIHFFLLGVIRYSTSFSFFLQDLLFSFIIGAVLHVIIEIPLMKLQGK